MNAFRGIVLMSNLGHEKDIFINGIHEINIRDIWLCILWGDGQNVALCNAEEISTTPYVTGTLLGSCFFLQIWMWYLFCISKFSFVLILSLVYFFSMNIFTLNHKYSLIYFLDRKISRWGITLGFFLVLQYNLEEW